jgi:hypothetical protein
MREAMVGLLALSLAACHGDTTRSANVVVSDSAGVSIVTISASGPLHEVQWSVEAEPEWSIGHIETDPDHALDRVVGAVTLKDGSIAVADMGSMQVRVYDRAGRYVRSIGRAGSGPGEFRQVTGLFRAGTDLLGIRDRLEALHA